MITAGVDVGSITAKAVIWAPAEETILGQALIRLEHNPAAAGEQAYMQALTAAKIPVGDIDAIAGTGYGRHALDFVQWRVTEISCHARGVYYWLPQVRTVIDIGGQDCKAIVLDEEGRALDFEMNDRCAAGTGRFLEIMAQTLGTDLPGLATLALSSSSPAPLSSICTVFAESEVIGLLAQGRARADIAAGLCRAIAQRVAGLTQRLGVKPDIALTGGVALNEAVRQALAQVLKQPILTPQEPQFTGALGAAIIAAERKAAEG